MTSMFGKFFLTHAHAVEHALRMAVRGVDHDHVDAGLDQRLDALLGALAHADRGADAQLAVRVLAGVRGARSAFRMSLTVIRPAQLEVAR